MIQLLKGPLFFLLTCVCLKSLALDLTKINMAYQYDLASPISFTHRITQSNDELHIYYTIKGDSVFSFDQFFLSQSSYSSNAHDTLKRYGLDTLLKTSNAITYRLKLTDKIDRLLLISFANIEKGIYLPFDIEIVDGYEYPYFVPYNGNGIPHVNNYFTDDNILIKGPVKDYHVFSYQDNFGAADPAMGMMKPIAPSLDIDSSFYVEGQFQNEKDYHFYLIQLDTVSANGVTLLGCPSYYPKFKRLEELMAPLTYITTPSENEALQNQMTKQAFEKFWIDTYTNKFRAKKAIKSFYDRVEAANLLFTNYKQGWETDRGMLYIIFGRPPEVIRTDKNEIWRYNDELEFEFIRISTLFTANLYTLKRHRDYEELWYDQVGNIRKGM